MEKYKIRWVIVGNCGLYTGQWQRRSDAIDGHCSAYLRPPFYPRDIERKWKECRKLGDHAVKAEIKWADPK